MKKHILAGCAVWMLTMIFSAADTKAGLNIQVNIGPPPIAIVGPPVLVVIPGTYAYVVPEWEVDIFFFDGWWWRTWGGHWYRSRVYTGGWDRCRLAPGFHKHVPSNWRAEYRNHRWHGHRWEYVRVSSKDVEKNWGQWKKDKHWEKQHGWGVKAQKPDKQDKPGRVAQKPGKGPKH